MADSHALQPPVAAPPRCKRHPEVETRLRCNRCDEPMCTRCAVHTPVGYRCRDCIREHQDRAYNMEPGDPWIAMGTGMVLAAVGLPVAGFVSGLVGIFLGLLIAFLTGGAAGTLLARIVRRAVQRRRGRRLGLFAVVGVLLGCLLGSAVLFVLTGRLFLSPALLVFLAVTLVSAWPLLK